ncbi:hypothetical protein [Shigella phage ESh4]|nr:hypothetical protein [Shigella phage ESh4]
MIQWLHYYLPFLACQMFFIVIGSFSMLSFHSTTRFSFFSL